MTEPVRRTSSVPSLNLDEYLGGSKLPLQDFGVEKRVITLESVTKSSDSFSPLYF